MKSDATADDENKYNEKLEKVKPTTVRHIILIRHGQYNLNGVTDSERYLTELGRKQAASTGERLNALQIPLDLMIRSTMTRAQETGKIISTCITNIPIENCSLIEEGAPIAPQPPIGHWNPEPYVSILPKTVPIPQNDDETNLIRFFFCVSTYDLTIVFHYTAVLPRWS